MVLALASLITALAYSGRRGEPYSLLNHFISELGEVGVSELAWLFNGALFAGGLCLTVFLLGLAVYMKAGWFSALFGAIGLITGVSGALVGIFPMNNLAPHARVAMTFFNMGLVATLLFSLYIALSRQRRLPRWMLAPGLLATAFFVAFVFYPHPTGSGTMTIEETTRRLMETRPMVWPMAILEWGMLISILVWALVVSLYLWARSRAKQS
ncbi:MAG: DUF998 domain-containing protein [Anaerolineae bacterium]|nr:DUF998 domain-containing protein [Anaerolineae bacterium]